MSKAKIFATVGAVGLVIVSAASAVGKMLKYRQGPAQKAGFEIDKTLFNARKRLGQIGKYAQWNMGRDRKKQLRYSVDETVLQAKKRLDQLAEGVKKSISRSSTP